MRPQKIPAVLAIALCASSASAQVSNDTALLSSEGGELSDIYWKGTPAVTDFVTKGFAGKTVEETAKASAAYAAYLDKMNAELVRLKNLPNMDPALSSEAQRYIDKNKSTATKLRKNPNWLKKVGNVLKVIDFVSTAAKASAYAVEGDSSGAVAVVVEDIVKKTAEAAGALGLSWIPGGQVAGAYLGEKAYGEYMAPALDAHEKRVRDSEWRAKYSSKPWLPSVSVILKDGTVQTLDPDTYVDKTSGLIRRRSPSDQEIFEATAKRKWKNGTKLLNLEKLRDQGEIDPETYDKILKDFRSHDPNELWKPDLVGLGLANFDGPTDDINGIEPQRVTASGAYVDDWIGSVTHVVTFWNVGAQVEGKGTVTIVSSYDGDRDVATGTFSGGPNGTFSFATEENGIVTFPLVNGYSIPLPRETTLTVQNPHAFDDWRK